MPAPELRQALVRIGAEAEAGVNSFAEAREEREEREQIAIESLAARDACRELIDSIDSADASE